MSPSRALTEWSTNLLAELLTAARDSNPLVLDAAVRRIDAECVGNAGDDDAVRHGRQLLRLSLLVLLVRVAEQGARHWCEDDFAGDWTATVTALREHLMGQAS